MIWITADYVILRYMYYKDLSGGYLSYMLPHTHVWVPGCLPTFEQFRTYLETVFFI